MATQIATAELTVIRAAGGVLLRNTPRGQEVMVVYRKDHRDWVLPKGKLRNEESFQEAALREAEEETGCRCHLADYMGTISYAQNGIPKVVMFWKMSVQEQKHSSDANALTDSLWMPLPSAISRLTYAQEKSLLTRLTEARRGPVPVQREVAPPPASEVSPDLQSVRESVPPTPTRDVSSALQSVPATIVTPISPPWTSKPGSVIFSSPKPGLSVLGKLSGLWKRKWFVHESKQWRMLQNEMEALQVEVAFLECRDGILDITWASAAWECLQKVKQYFKKKDMAGGWRALRAARRYSILGLNPPELCARGQILREEARKMTSWRGAAIQRLLATSDDQLTAPRIADAMALRDEDHAEQTEQARTFMARMRLLLILCVAAPAMLASLSTTGAYYDYAPLGFLGLLGSALAAVQLLIQGREERKMPGRVMMLVMVLGAAIAGLAADTIYRNIAHYFKLKHDYDFAVYLLAFALGYAGHKLLARLSGYSHAPQERAVYY